KAIFAPKVAKTQALFAVATDVALRFAACTLAAHFGIDPRTKQNHNRNVVPRRGSALAPARASAKAMRGLRGLAARVNEALTTSATWLRQQRDCRARAKPVVRVDGHPCRVKDRNGRNLRRARRRSISRGSVSSRVSPAR